MTRLINPNDPNVVMLTLVAERLGNKLCREFVFVGGAVAGLLITDPANPSVRPTIDVDIVVEAQTIAQYHQIERDLRQRGFKPDLSIKAPICRWCIEGVTVDVMPTNEAILGFANRWYPQSVATAELLQFPGDNQVRVIRAPLFIATKLEAFHGRGAGDYLFSHDLGDILSVIDGRQSLVQECLQMSEELQQYLAEQFTALLGKRAFRDALPGHLPTDSAGQGRLKILETTLQQLAKLGHS